MIKQVFFARLVLKRTENVFNKKIKQTTFVLN